MSTFLDNKTYSLCEAVADLSANFIVAPKIPADSRAMTALCIGWAVEFEEKYGGREWDGEYIEVIDEFFAAKYAAWLDATAPREVTENDRLPVSA